MKANLKSGRRATSDGFSLIELMIAMTVMTVGLAALAVLIMVSAASNNRNKTDTTATFVTQLFLENIINQQGGGQVTITDCASPTATSIVVSTAGPGAVGTSNGANLMADGTGRIDFTQSAATVPANYKAVYVTCGSGSRNASYDVRWNVRTISAKSRMVTVAARPVNVLGKGTKSEGLYFAPPANLRTIISAN